jgi:DNA replication protein DnaD
MTKVKARSKGRGAKGKTSKGKTSTGGKSVDIAGVRQAMTRLVALEADEMVQAVIDEAKKGHSVALKYLFEMIGLYPATLESEQSEKREMSLAELFCRELGLPMHPPEAQTGEPEAAEPARESHDVE